MPAVTLMPSARQQFFDDNGVPLASGRLFTYQGGTGDDKATYTDATGQTAHANPVVLDAAGRATVYLAAGAYKLVVRDADNVILWTEDGVVAGAAVSDVDTVADLKALIPGNSSLVRTLGRLAKNDGGGWSYYWEGSSTEADDGGMVIQPASLPTTGRWIGVKPDDGVVPLRVYGAVMDAVTDDVSVLQKCAAYCDVRGFKIWVDGNLVLATDPEIDTPLVFAPNAYLTWGNFSPSLTVEIPMHDTNEHFYSPVEYAPTLDTAYLRPEWFGETADSHPKMTACLALSHTTDKIMFTGIVATNNAEME